MDLPTLKMYASLSNWAVVAFSILTTLAGFSARYFSGRVNDLKDAQLEERLKQRTITAEQDRMLRNRLAASSAKCPVILIAPPGDNEAQAFHQTISFVLERTGWLGSRLYRPISDVPVGIRLVQYEGAEPKACVQELDRALTDVLNMKPEFKVEPLDPKDPDLPGIPPDSIKMIIGRKP